MSIAKTAVPAGHPVPRECVTVSFAGEGSGVDELSWGQWGIWLSMLSHESWMPLGGTKALEPGTTVQEVVEELRYLMGRFPSMRTRLRFDPAGRPTQELFDAGDVALEIYEADGVGHPGGVGDPGALAAAVEAQYRQTPLDFAAEWPVRMAVIRSGNALTHMVAIMCHLVTDGIGSLVMLREVAARETKPVTGMQQLEQARWQRSPAGQRQNAAALYFWEKTLRAIAPRRLPDSMDRRDPRHWSAQFHSPALRLAAGVIADRTRAGSSAVLMALFASALARITAINPVVIRPVVHNRFRPGLTGVVCQVAQNGICSVDVADATFDEVAGRAKRATTIAYKNAYYDPEQHAALVERIAQERGPDFDVACFFNDRRVDDPEMVGAVAAVAAVTPELLRQAQSDSAFVWTEKKQNPYERMFVHIDEDSTGVVVTVCADTHYFPPAHIEALAWGMEALAVEAAVDPAVSALEVVAAVDRRD
jgi:hypothetical protein